MIEGIARKQYQKLLVDPFLPSIRLSPGWITFASCLFGLTPLPLLYFQFPLSAFFFLILSGFLDTVDGSLARKNKITSDKGAAFDLISDRIVESAVLIGLYLVDPVSRALPLILMFASIFLCTSSFFIVSLLSNKTSEKSFYYSPGIIERAEAFFFFGLMILFPKYFLLFSSLFSSLVCLTALLRMNQFRKSK